MAQTPLPIRLSYHNGNHYNSIDDLDHSNYLDALGVPGQHGGVEKTNVDTALAQSEQEMIEKEMMASSLADSQAQDAAAEEARLVELALKDSVEEAMGTTHASVVASYKYCCTCGGVSAIHMLGSCLTIALLFAPGRGVAVPDPGAWMGDFAAPGMGGGAAAAAADGPEGGVAAPSIGHAAGDIEQLVSMVRPRTRCPSPKRCLSKLSARSCSHAQMTRNICGRVPPILTFLGHCWVVLQQRRDLRGMTQR